MKFLHAADLHIDSPMIGLDRYEGAPVEALRGASRRAMENLVKLAVGEQVAFVVIAGDVFDGDWKDYNTGLFFVRCMARLREAGIPVWMISGNHDAASRISKSLTLPENVHRFSDARAETSVDEKIGIAVHGRGFTEAKLSANVVPDYPESVDGLFNIGLLHTSLGGRPGNATYAPCSPGDLHGKGYQYWALGHVHTREIVAESPSWIVFPGNPQGRHVRETGPRGCMLVEVGDDRRVIGAEFRPLDVARWDHIVVDASGCIGRSEALEAVRDAVAAAAAAAQDRLLAARVEITGSTPAHAELADDREALEREVHALAIDLGGDQIWIEKTILSTKAPAEDAFDEDDLLAGLAAAFSEKEAGDLFDEIDRFASWLPGDIARGADGLDLASDPLRSALLERAREMARDALLHART